MVDPRPIPIPTFPKILLNQTKLTAGDLVACLRPGDPGPALVDELKRVSGAEYVSLWGSGSEALMVGLGTLPYDWRQVEIPTLMCRRVIEAILARGLDPRIRSNFGIPFVPEIIFRVGPWGKEITDCALDTPSLSTRDRFSFTSFNMGKPLSAGGGGALMSHTPAPLAKRPPAPWTRTLISLLARERFRAQVAPLAALRRRAQGDCRGGRPVIVPRQINKVQATLALRRLRELEDYKARSQAFVNMAYADLKPYGAEGIKGAWSYCPILVVDRYALAMALRKKGIQTGWSYYPLHLMDDYKQYADSPDLEAERLASRLLYLPIDGHKSNQQVNMVIAAVSHPRINP